MEAIAFSWIHSTMCMIGFLTVFSLDEMGQRVDELEKNIGDLMQQVETREEAADKKQ